MQPTTGEPSTREARADVDARTYAAIPAWVLRDPRRMAQLNGSGWAVLAVLALHADAESGRCWPSLRTIGAYLGHTSAAQRGMAQLLELGIVTVSTPGSGKRPTVYQIAATPPDRTAGSAPVGGCATASKRTAGKVREVGPDESGAPTHGCAGETVAHPLPAVAHLSEARSAPAHGYRTENREQAAAQQTAAAALSLEEHDPADVALVRSWCNGTAEHLLRRPGMTRAKVAAFVQETRRKATKNPGAYFRTLCDQRAWPPAAVAPTAATEQRTTGVEDSPQFIYAAAENLARARELADKDKAEIAAHPPDVVEAARQRVLAGMQETARSAAERFQATHPALRHQVLAELREEVATCTA